MPRTENKEYKRGYRDGFAHIDGLPEPIYRPIAYPDYVSGHKAGRFDRNAADRKR